MRNKLDKFNFAFALLGLIGSFSIFILAESNTNGLLKILLHLLGVAASTNSVMWIIQQYRVIKGLKP